MHKHTMGHASAVVYRLRSARARNASGPERRYVPVGSVRMRVQLLIAATSPMGKGSLVVLVKAVKFVQRPLTGRRVESAELDRGHDESGMSSTHHAMSDSPGP